LVGKPEKKPRPRREGNIQMDLHRMVGLGLDLPDSGYEAIVGSL
jgi:hypothetical protein